jgi:cation transport ATPase
VSDVSATERQQAVAWTSAVEGGACCLQVRDKARTIRQNYAIVAGLNTLALGLALPGGLISPSITALISNGSAILASG